MNYFHSISGGTSTELIKNEIQKALVDDQIDAIVLDIDSPGGTVDGTKELNDFIYGVKDQKPILAHANGLMASAAYWIGSAVEMVTAYDTTQIGSIGVIAAHYDFSKRDEIMGVKRTYLYSGKYKAVGHDAAPLSKEDKAYIQEKLDSIYTLFVADIARNRNTKSDNVLSKMADGKIFLAAEAKKVGLIDRIMNLDQTIQLAARMANGEDIEEDEEIEGSEEAIEFEAPYPNEHACRLHDPKKYERFTRGKRNHKGKEYSVIYGWKNNKSEDQAYRYNKQTWTTSEARSHCDSHGGSFEAAKDNKKAEGEIIDVLAFNEPDWGTIDKTKLPRSAFADMGDLKKKSSWGYPHHWVKDGKTLDEMGCYKDGELLLHKGGLRTARQAAGGASEKKAVPAIKEHLDKHAKDIGMGDENKSQTSTKEEIMNKEELKEQYPNLYVEIIDLGKEEGRRELQPTVAAKETEIGVLTEKNRQLEKDLLIEKANVQAEKVKTEAGKIMDEILVASSINEVLHPKLKSMLDYETFKKDGTWDKEAFKAAFQAEVKDWEDKLPKGSYGLGLEESKTDTKNKDEDIEYGKRLAKECTGSIRSDN